MAVLILAMITLGTGLGPVFAAEHQNEIDQIESEIQNDDASDASTNDVQSQIEMQEGSSSNQEMDFDNQKDESLEPITGDEASANSAESETNIEKKSNNKKSLQSSSVTWSFDSSSGTLTISGTGAMDDYSNYYVVPWYSYREAIKEIIISNGVTSIGDYAFYNCKELTSMIIPDSVTSIENNAFYGCSRLTSITIPDSVASIGSSAFEACEKLTSMTIPDSVTSIGNKAFSSCRNLTSVTIPDTVTNIGDRAFFYCTSLTSITIPDGVKTIGSSTFYNCTSLTSITIPNTVTRIGSHAFYNCNSLTSITIPDSVTDIGEQAFYCCSSLKSIAIPNGVTWILYRTFYNCTGLTSISIPNTVTVIGVGAFCNCKSLSSITIPDGVKTICGDAFYACTSLTSITIPNTVTTIEGYAFCKCAKLNDVTISNPKVSIGKGAFSGCPNELSICCSQGIHSYNADIVTVKEATCVEEGIKSFTCPNCGETFSETIPKIEHVWDSGVITKEANCSQEGVRTFSCNKCNEQYTEVIPKTEHDWNTGTVTKAATCSREGIRTISCKNCEAKYTETIPINPSNHTYISEPITQASCTQSGENLYTCTGCGHQYTKQISATGHRWDSGTVTRSATCETNGVRTYHCTNDRSHTKTESIPAIGHSYDSYSTKTVVTNLTNGKKIATVKQYVCNNCWKTKTETVSGYTITLNKASYTYNAKANMPSISAKTFDGKTIAASNYSVSYSNNTNAGTAKAVVTMKGGYSGTYTLPFKITPKQYENRNFDLFVTKKVGYNGRSRVPTFTFCFYNTDANGDPVLNTLVKNRDFTVSVNKTHKKIGTYTATVKFKGNYKGTIKHKYQIVPPKVKIKSTKPYSTKQIKVTWKKTKKAKGYKVYRYVGTRYKLYKKTKKTSCLITRASKKDDDVYFYVVAYTKKNGKEYTSAENITVEALKPGKAKIRTVVTDFGEFYVKPSTTGYYQIKVAADKKFKHIRNNWKGYATTKGIRYYNFNDLDTYYVKARKYNYTRSGRLIRGPWSDVKAVHP